MSRSASLSLMTVGYAREGYGYGRVLQELGSRISRRFRVDHLDLASGAGAPTWADGFYVADRWDRYGQEILPVAIAERQPDVVLIYTEATNLHHFGDALRELPNRPAVIAYVTVDGPIEDPASLGNLDFVDRLLVMTRAGGELLEAALSVAPGTNTPPIGLLPHGVGAESFYPMIDRRNPMPDARRDLLRRAFPEHHCPEDSFIVLNANRNTPRKRLDVTARGFAQFARDKPENVKLCIHAGVQDAGWHLDGLAFELGIEDRLIIPHRVKDGAPEVSDERLNAIYNACDVGINTSGGEAWGLVAFEHAATGAPQIVPDHPACAELWRGCASILMVGSPIGPGPLGMCYPDPEDVAHHLEQLYLDRDLRLSQGERCAQRASEDRFTWESVANVLSGHCLATLEATGLSARPLQSRTKRTLWISPSLTS